MVISHRRFGTTYRSHLQGSGIKISPKCGQKQNTIHFTDTTGRDSNVSAGNNRVTFSMSCRTATVYKGVQGAKNKSSTQSRLELFETFQFATAVKPTGPRSIQIRKFQVHKVSVVQMMVYFGEAVIPGRKTLCRFFGGKYYLLITEVKYNEGQNTTKFIS